MIKGDQIHFELELDQTLRQQKPVAHQVLVGEPGSSILSRGEQSWVGYGARDCPTNFYRFAKRMIDLTIAGLGFILCLPLLIVIAMLIKLDSPGPVIFRQIRIGKNRRFHNNGHLRNCRNGDLKGKPFEIYKFRTMRQESDCYAISPQDENDNRLTRVGRIIRAYCLDELPQLINVLKGDMSLVGPRPEMPFIVAKYGRLELLRLTVKPGISGLWQLYGSRSKAIHENLQYDLDYIKNRSLKLDIKIMLRTIIFIGGSKNV